MNENFIVNFLEKNKDIIEIFKQEHSDYESGYFNNFHGNLPGGYRRRNDTERDLQTRLYVDDERVSELKKKQTWGEFIGTIDEVITSLSLTLEQAAYLVNEWAQYGEDEVYDAFIPVYLELRKIGYNDSDLSR